MLRFQSLDDNLFDRLLLIIDNGDTVNARFFSSELVRNEETWSKTSWTMMRIAIQGLCAEYFK